MISKFFFALKFYCRVPNALILYYDTVDKPENTHNFFIQTSKSEYGMKVLRCEIMKLFHGNNTQHSQRLMSSFILSIHNRKASHFITNFNDQFFKYHVNIPTDRITSLYLMVISTQHKINYTYIKRISHSKPFRHQNDPLYIGNLWAKSALCNGWEGEKIRWRIHSSRGKKNRSTRN